MSIPQIRNRNVFLYYLINILHNFWFVEGIWFFFWSKFTSFTNIGFAFSIFALVAISAEIPTGVLADKFGRKKSIIAGCFFLTLGILFITFATSFIHLFIGGILESLGRAFVSGSMEALVYDDLKTKNQQSSYSSVITFKSQVAIAAFALGTLFGGLLYPIYFRLPYIVQFLGISFSLISSFFIIENFIPKKQQSLIQLNLKGFTQLTQTKFLPFLIPTLIIFVSFYLFDWGFSKPAIAVNAGLMATGQSITYAIMAIINTFLIGLIPTLRRYIKDYYLLIIFALIIGLGYFIGGLALGIFGILSLLMIDLASNLSEPLVNIIANQHIDSASRATSLSTLQFLSKVPYILINLIAGFAIDHHFINPFHLIFGITIIVCVFLIFTFNNQSRDIIQNKS